MAVINFGERWSVRQIDTSEKVTEWTSQVSYIATTSGDNESHWEVFNYADLNGPQADNILVRSDLAVTQISARRYYCLYDFAHPDSERTKPDKTPEDASEASFTTIGGTLSIRNSLATVQKTRFGVAIVDGSKFDNKLVINYDFEKKTSQPIDIVHGQLGWTETKVFADPLPCEFVEMLRDFTATTNNADWKCFKHGEVLFKGVTGARRGTGDWELVFNFSVVKNLVNATYPDPTPSDPNNVITYSKKGHEYLWVYPFTWIEADQQQQQGKAAVQRIALYVEQVYNESDFTQLGLGE